MSTCACVLGNNGERLMPTIRLGRVRHLLKDGKAKSLSIIHLLSSYCMTVKQTRSPSKSVRMLATTTSASV